MTSRFMLPASGLVVQEATRYWRLLPGETGDEILPDIPVAPDAVAWMDGKDTVLEAALALTF